ncbi:MAG: DNA alkylation repair protein [Gemmataceae bacterium]
MTANRPSDVPPDILAALNAGTRESKTLAEGLAVNHAALLRAAVPDLDDAVYADIESQGERGITRRMEACGDVLLAHMGLDGALSLARHPSDTVRGWVCFAIGRAEKLKLSERLERIRPFADDRHFGVREWAWLPLRGHLSKNVGHSIAALKPWTKEKSANLRRFAVESTRPHGVWSVHIAQLKQNPSLGLPLLEPLKADPEVYVQDSVSNWLNDAAKSQPGWVREVCERWRESSSKAATERICTRAMRNVKMR